VDGGRNPFVESSEGKKPRYRGLVHFGSTQKLIDALKANGLVRSASPFTDKVPSRGVT
jgi:hypothetical protein